MQITKRGIDPQAMKTKESKHQADSLAWFFIDKVKSLRDIISASNPETVDALVFDQSFDGAHLDSFPGVSVK